MHNGFQCTKETKLRQFQTSSEYGPQRTAVHGHASHPLWDVIRKPQAGYRCEASKSTRLLCLIFKIQFPCVSACLTTTLIHIINIFNGWNEQSNCARDKIDIA